MRDGCAGRLEIAILLQFLAIEPHFVRKGCTEQLEIAILPEFLAIEPHFVRKGSRDKRDDLKSQFYLSFRRSNLISCERVHRKNENHNFTSVFGDRTSFRAKGLRGTTCNSQFYFSFWRSNLISCERVARDKLKSQFYFSFWRSNLISCEKVAFRAVSLALPLPPALKREIAKRARGQEGKRRRCEDVRMWR